MPEFDEETYKSKNNDNQALKYEPGRNADKYKSKQPKFQKKGASEDAQSSSLWVEAATSTSYTPPKQEKRKKSPMNDKNRSTKNQFIKKGSQPQKGTGKGNQSNNRNNRRGRNRNRRKLTLWEKFLGLFGIKPKRKPQKGNRKNQHGKNPNNRAGEKKQGNKNRPNERRNPRSGNQNQRSGQDRNRQGKPKGRSGEARDASKPRGENAEKRTPKPKGDGNSEQRTKRPRRSNQERRDGQKPAANRERKPREAGDADKPARSERPKSKPRSEKAERSAPKERRQDSENPRPKRQAEGRVESVAAPKTEGGQLTLGAIELGSSNKSTAPVKKPASGGRSRRNRAGASRPGQTAPTSNSKEFVPHPIEIKPNTAESKKD